jgi:hypothetical protein
MSSPLDTASIPTNQNQVKNLKQLDHRGKGEIGLLKEDQFNMEFGVGYLASI